MVLSKFLGLPKARRALLAEAAFTLALARVALRVVPFRRLKAYMTRPVKGPEVAGVARAHLRKEVAWAVRTAARHLPGDTVCFPRGIATQVLLRRRGVGTTLYYGVARTPETGPTAHVWVQDGAQGVMGYWHARCYTILAAYGTSRN